MNLSRPQITVKAMELPSAQTALMMTYSAKNADYFGNARRGFIDELPDNPAARLLEIGAGEGSTAAYAQATNKCGWTCGVELCETAAAIAMTKMDQVIIGDVEKVALEFPERHFDVLILSEILEHLVDPWKVLKRLRPLMKPGALVHAGSPNVCHWSVIKSLLAGRWQYEERGIFDATHLRWFSPLTYREMFMDSGYVVDSVSPANPLRAKARLINAVTFGKVEHLLHTQLHLRAHCAQDVGIA